MTDSIFFFFEVLMRQNLINNLELCQTERQLCGETWLLKPQECVLCLIFKIVVSNNLSAMSITGSTTFLFLTFYKKIVLKVLFYRSRSVYKIVILSSQFQASYFLSPGTIFESVFFFFPPTVKKKKTHTHTGSGPKTIRKIKYTFLLSNILV